MDKDIYCVEQIKIPPSFPHILKLYAKAAIRTQPYDLLQWTSAYFRALASGDVPPVKERLEYPPFSHPTGITPGYLRTLLNVFGHVEAIPVKSMLERWQGIALPETSLFRILMLGKCLTERELHFYKFLAMACGFLGKNLFETMIYVCELLTEEPEGGSAMIPLRTFLRLYEYLAELDCSGTCDCLIMEEITKELFRPTVASISTEETSTSYSKLYSLSSVIEEEEEDTAGSADVCQLTPQESRSAEPLRVLQDRRIDTRHSEVDEELREQLAHSAQREEIKDRSMEEHGNQDQPDRDRKVDSDVESHQTTISDFHFMDKNSDLYKDDDSFSYYGGEESEKEAIFEPMDDYEPIGLETILHGICECLEPVREVERVPTPPPADPFEEFLKRMKLEIEEGRLETRFRVEGIGPPVSENRITSVAVWLADCARRQEGMVGPRNIRHFLCPDLEDPHDNTVAN
ncbi:Ropporin-1-like protein [Habropoda laboriosa]|uniref:Ropporin-1-like protein n=1 Tax=Habropoda laboriosa TaxID=597456 RepID=A0A0L7R6I4_9HYME|nr:Ropporin-1-like protein [Habropoda laboriosa]